MIDIDEQTKPNGDIYLVDTDIFKTRNLLKMKVDDDLYEPIVGLNTDILLTYRLTKETVNSNIATYLGNNDVFPNSIELDLTKKGKLDIRVVEDFSYINSSKGFASKKNKKEVAYNVNL